MISKTTLSVALLALTSNSLAAHSLHRRQEGVVSPQVAPVKVAPAKVAKAKVAPVKVAKAPAKVANAKVANVKQAPAKVANASASDAKTKSKKVKKGNVNPKPCKQLCKRLENGPHMIDAYNKIGKVGNKCICGVKRNPDLQLSCEKGNTTLANSRANRNAFFSPKATGKWHCKKIRKTASAPVDEKKDQKPSGFASTLSSAVSGFASSIGSLFSSQNSTVISDQASTAPVDGVPVKKMAKQAREHVAKKQDQKEPSDQAASGFASSISSSVSGFAASIGSLFSSQNSTVTSDQASTAPVDGEKAVVPAKKMAKKAREHVKKEKVVSDKKMPKTVPAKKKQKPDSAPVDEEDDMS